MTKFVIGDRVRVTLTGTVHDTNGDVEVAVRLDGDGVAGGVVDVRTERVERLPPPEPTGRHAVARTVGDGIWLRRYSAAESEDQAVWRAASVTGDSDRWYRWEEICERYGAPEVLYPGG
jgi:hypothetical protein